MKCPNCGERLFVTHTYVIPEVTRRRRECECGVVALTVETISVKGKKGTRDDSTITNLATE